MKLYHKTAVTSGIYSNHIIVKSTLHNAHVSVGFSDNANYGRYQGKGLSIR